MVAIITDWNWVNALYEHIERCYQWHLSLTHKRRAHIHRFTFTIKIREFGGSACSNVYFKWGVILLLRSFEWIWKMVSNYAIVLSDYQLSQICLYTIWTCFYLCLSVYHDHHHHHHDFEVCTRDCGGLSRGSLLNPFHHMLIEARLFGPETCSYPIFFCTFVCLCFFFVIQWVRFRNRNWNIANFFKSFSSTLSTNIKKTSTQIYFVNCKWFKGVRVTPDTLSHLSTGSNGSNVKCLIIRITFRCRTSNSFYRIRLQMRSNQFQNQESIAYNN